MSVHDDHAPTAPRAPGAAGPIAASAAAGPAESAGAADSARSCPLARVVTGRADAPVLVLLHGITGSAISQADAITHWTQAGYCVVALDARGHGLSPRWRPDELERAGEQLVDDVAEVLTDMADDAAARRAHGLPAPTVPPVLVGHSMGAATAMVVAARRPELVTGVVLGDPARYGSRTPAELVSRGAARERSLLGELADVPAAIARSLADDELPDREAVVGTWASQQVDPWLLRTGVVAPEVPWAEAMASLRVPTLLVTGDRPGSARVGAEGLGIVDAQNNPQVRTVMVAGAGHDVRRTRPAGFYAAVDAWLAEFLPVPPGGR